MLLYQYTDMEAKMVSQINKNENTKLLMLFGGLAYIGVIATGVYAEGVVRGSLIDSKDAILTMKNIAQNMGLMRIAAVNDILILVFDLIAALCLYSVLKSVNRDLSLLTLLFRVIAIGVLSIAAIFAYVPMLLLNGGTYLNVFDANQLAALGLLSIKIHNLSYHVSLILFAINNVMLGILMFKSEHFAKFIAAATIVFGISYFTNSFGWFVAPDFQAKISGIALKTSFFCELALSLWMVYKGFQLKKSQ